MTTENKFPAMRTTHEAEQGDDILLSMEVAGDEVYREYDSYDPMTGANRVYRIASPVTVEYRIGGTTHRVTDADDVTHIVPAPGFYGCVIRIKNRPEGV